MIFVSSDYQCFSFLLGFAFLFEVFTKPGKSGHMMVTLDADIYLASMMCVLGSNFYELHPMH